MELAKYENLSTKKLFNTLDTTNHSIKKLQAEQNKITKKMNSLLIKQSELQSILDKKLNKPNKATIKAIKECEANISGEYIENYIDFHKQMKLEVKNEA